MTADTSHFDDARNEISVDYRRVMQTLLQGGYRGYIGINYQGRQLSEAAGITAAKAMLTRVHQLEKSRKHCGDIRPKRPIDS